MDLDAELAATNTLQLRALELLEREEIQAAKQEGERALLETLPFVDERSMAKFPEASREIATAALLFALMDPEYPVVLCTELMPRLVDGLRLPGSRAMDDNPDTVYRFLPVDARGRYVITGRFRAERPFIHQFSLISEDWTTQHNFTAEDLSCDADGVFTIEIDSGPPAGRTNHIQSREGAFFLHIRDTLADWSRQMPSLVSIRRLDPPVRPGLTDGQVIDRCAAFVREWYKRTIILHDEAVTRDPNVFPQPMVRDRMAMLVTQAYSIGRFEVSPETALVLTLRMGGARYLSVALTNLWGISNDPVRRQASLNMLQAARNDDGSFTFVVSLQDPGVANWIDPDGLPQGLLFLRWAAIDPGYSGAEAASVASETVPMGDLHRVVPSTMPEVASAARSAQLEERARLFDRRWRE